MKPEHYFNREISWLEFNQRVLDQAMDQKVRLLERLKFLAITASNLDEFFMVRVGGLQLQHNAGVQSTDPAGMTVSDQLDAILERTDRMIETQYKCLHEQLEPALAEEGIERIKLDNASHRHIEAIKKLFEAEILPVLSPLATTGPEDFPLLSNQSLNVCVQLPPAASGGQDEASDEEPKSRFVIIPCGRALSRILTLPSDRGFSYALLEDVVTHYAARLIGGEEIVAAATFRITRNADMSIREDLAADLLHGMKELLQQRKTADCVRLEVDRSAPKEMVAFLQSCLAVDDRKTVLASSPLDLSDLIRLSGLEGFEHLKDPSWPPQRSPQIDPSRSIFSIIAENDVLLSHPYESFSPVVQLIEEAAKDPDVLAIKQTLYRTSRNSPIVNALREAAERGKYVTAIVELKARFDEARNIEWARELEEAGVHVIYGVKRLKTHAKIAIIVRREPRGIVRYMHFGTGNYNESTARLYSDMSLLTCDDELGLDAGTFFNAITGYSQPQPYALLEAAPIGLRKKVLSLIEAEIERKKQGQRARIIAKLNALVDPQLIEALYRASQAGVTVRLNIRGVCCLRPGIPGLSENITVVSIVDRMLEHARMVYFYHGGDELAFLSSADWMPRNLDRRVELLVPVEDKRCKKRFIATLESYFLDTTNSWELLSDGRYIRRKSQDASSFRVQEFLFEESRSAIQEEESKKRTVFEPYQAADSED